MFKRSVRITKTFFFDEFTISKDLFSRLKKTTRRQKRNAVAELVSGDFDASIAEKNTTENLVAGPSKNPRIEPENLEKRKTSLRREIMTDSTKILAENQKEMLKLIALLNKKQPLSVQTSRIQILNQKTFPWQERPHP